MTFTANLLECYEMISLVLVYQSENSLKTGFHIWENVHKFLVQYLSVLVTFRELFSLEEILFVENVMDMKNKKKRSCASLLTVNVCKTFEVFSVNISFCTHIIIKP